MKTREYEFYYENKIKGKYKIFGILPAINVVRDTQMLKDFGISSWEFYFEWLWFQVSFSIDTTHQLNKQD